MADESNHPIIIVKKKKHAHHPHHGGAWKVAYADFVTAMMAFFLLLWLLNVTTDDQKRGIAQFFTPESVSRSTSGSGGVLGGLNVSPGNLPSNSPTAMIQTPPPLPPENRPTAEESDSEPGGPAEEAARKPEEQQREATEADVLKALARREEQEFEKAEQDLRRAIEDIPEMRQLAQNLLIDRTPEGLRIQIVDQDKTSMFPLGSSAPYEHTKKLLALVTQVVLQLHNGISVTGHTDATPFSRTNAYSNWELSTDRANSSRRTMLESGLPAERISRVIGKADRDPLLANDPSDPRNRRISIVLLREARAQND